MGTAPESSGGIAELLETTQYEVAHDRPALHLEATAFFGKGLVVLTDRTMQQIWLVAYLSWRALPEQSGFVIVSLATTIESLYRAVRHRALDISSKANLSNSLSAEQLQETLAKGLAHGRQHPSAIDPPAQPGHPSAPLCDAEGRPTGTPSSPTKRRGIQSKR